jgi:hypothetical protein
VSPPPSSRDKIFRDVAVLAALGTLVMAARYLAGLHWSETGLILDRHGAPLGQDFVNTWFYGRAFFEADPGRFYDRLTFAHHVDQVLPKAAIASRIWSYPPPLILLAAPVGGLSYLAAFVVWSLAGLIALSCAVLRRGSPLLLVAVLAAPITYAGLVTGQLALFAAACAVSAFTLLDRRPLLAGMLLACFIIKPQLALLVPILLLAGGRWRVIVGGVIGGALIVGASLAWSGVDTWRSFLAQGIPSQLADIAQTRFALATISASFTSSARQFDLSPSATLALQSAAGLVGGLITAFVGWRGRTKRLSPEFQGLVALTCSVLATPYMMIPDLCAVTALALIVSYREGLIQNRFVLLLIVSVPVLQGLGFTLLICVVPWLALIFAFWLAKTADVATASPEAASRANPAKVGTGSATRICSTN